LTGDRAEGLEHAIAVPGRRGAALPPLGGASSALLGPPHHLVTHGVVLGMTGSGKTGLLMVMVEEALQPQVR
jgi:hypothetical protein